jgi:hypothetical protein
VSDGLVFAGEIMAMSRSDRIGCTVWAVEEFSVPITPTTLGSEARRLAACEAICGRPWSSSAWRARV